MRRLLVAIVGSFLLAAAAVTAFFATRFPPKPPATAHLPATPIPTPTRRGSAEPRAPRPCPIRLEDITDRLGIDFVSFSGMTPDKHFPTANGTGVALLDYDQDGWLDLYFVNSCRLDQPSDAPPNALYRSRAGASYERVGDSVGTSVTGFTQGVAVADYNNDGFPDIYLLRYGPNILLENNGDGTFRDATESSGLGDKRWGTSAAFLDYDEDGTLDVYVAHYGKWDMDWHNDHFCGQERPPVRIYCSPKMLAPEVHALYHGHGDGRFSDVAAELGIARSGEQGGRGQGVVASDVNNDGHIDLYVANDLSPNFLFINTGHGGFEDQTEISCAAYNAEGQSEASMGVDAADVDGDGLPELFVTNFYHEHNTLYRNLSKPGNTLFQDVSQWTGVAAGSMLYVGWGTGFEDLDGDGWLDIFVTNGHVDDNLDKLSRDEPYAQPPAVWRNAGKGQFEKFLEEAGPYFGTKHVGRGAAFGDLDNDGQVDIVVSYKDERPTVLHNESRAHAAQPNAWTQLRMIGTRSNRDGIGVRVEIEAGEKRWTREIRGGRSYLSAHDLRLTIGLGDAPRIDRLIVHWPSGQVSRLENLDVNRPYTIREPVAAPPVASP